MPHLKRIAIPSPKWRPDVGLVVVLVGAATTVASPIGDVGTDHHWTCIDGGLFTDPECWFQQVVPGVLDTPVFDLESTYVVDFGDAPLANDGLRVRKGSATFDLAGTSYELLGVLTDGPTVLVGFDPGFVAELVLIGQPMTADAVSVGRSPAAIGSIRLGSENGETGMLIAPELLEIGREGNGTLTLLGESTALAGELVLGQSVTASGTAELVDESTLQCSGAMTVAEIGVGTMSLRDSATAWCDRAIVAGQSGGVGTITLAGADASWTVDASLDVGMRGSGMLSVSGGAEVSVGTALFIGTLSSSQGTALGVVEVTGSASRLNVGGDLWIGFNGQGGLAVDTDGRVVVDGTVRHGTAPENVLEVTLGDAGEYDGEPALAAGAVLAGLRVAVELGDQYTPVIGDRFALIETSGSLGAPNLELPELESLEWTVELDADRLVVEISNVPEDVNADGAVDTDDLVAVILNWGVCPAGPADCPGDVNDDGIVDEDDLALVIGGWS